MKRQRRPAQTGPLSAEQADRQYRSVRKALGWSTAMSWVVAVLVVLLQQHDRKLVAVVAAVLAVVYTVTSVVALRAVKKGLENRVERNAFEQPGIGLE